MILDDIISTKRREIELAKERVPLQELQARLRNHMAERDFRKAITQSKKLSLIAELKRKSPSRGVLRERFDPVSLGQQLQEAGASALSVLTDEMFFGGTLEFLRDVQHFTEVPILRKDFIFEPYQVYEAAFHQADAVLLIVGILTHEELGQCLMASEQVGIDALVEVHSEGELEIALKAGAGIIGINSRDLNTFKLKPDISQQLVPQIPSGKAIVAESGVTTREDVQRLQALGVHAVLIGEALMRASDPAAKARELFEGIG